MKYYEIDINNIIIKVQPYIEDGLKEDETDKAICGMIDNLDGTFSNPPSSQDSVRLQAKEDRDNALQDMTHTFADSTIVQVRPQDISNFQIAISGGISEEWVLKDNSVRLTTVAELQEAMDSGIAQGIVIWDTYKTVLKGL